MPEFSYLLLGAVPAALPANLRALLTALAPAPEQTIVLAEDCPCTPFEQALAHLRGLRGTHAQPGRMPWAALDNRITGQPCAWLTPCHWSVGMSEVRLTNPCTLTLDEAQSRALFDAAAPYFAQDGLTLHWRRPDAWLAMGEPLREAATVSVRRAAGRALTPDTLLTGPAARSLRRLQNEMQMLLYAHPVNDARTAAGLAPVNSLWISGAGALDELPALVPDLRAECDWHDGLDTEAAAALLARLRARLPVRLTLCGEHAARTWGPAPMPAWQRAAASFLGVGRKPLVLNL